ncbi:MAG: MFS transporter, partial [Hyphomicrobiaceae bacterium]|nr:MFS transporter [Hyphomicrobiaceae bacterium]MDX2449680.1 MFS transporter [Hyphomicrobiaceae bacterium]
LFPTEIVFGLIAIGITSCWLYVRHARKTPNPLLDLNLLRIDTFYASVVGGFLFRIGVGASPFLLPLFLQLGFGMTPLQSGMLTFATAVGAIAMKTTAAPILRRVGFKRVLVWNAVISALFIATASLFSAATPSAVIMAVLLVGGFFRSLEFTAVNSLAYADIGDRDMSKATSFASVGQQLSMSAGVAVAALVLEFERMGRGSQDVLASDFPAAFLVVAAFAASSAFVFMRLPKTAGSSLATRAHPVGETQKDAAGQD